MRLATRPSPPDPIAAAISGVLEDAAHSIGPAEQGMLAFVQGLLTAAAIGPERTFPHEWIGAIFLGYRFEDADAAQAASALLSLMHDRILEDLRRKGAEYSPAFLERAEDGEKVGLAREWSSGFVAGMQLRGKAWEALATARDARLLPRPHPRVSHARGRNACPADRFRAGNRTDARRGARSHRPGHLRRRSILEGAWPTQ
jgi:yecA family protein